MHDEALAIEQIKAIPKDAKLHISHILRNGLCSILGATYTDGKEEVRRRLKVLEDKIQEMGL